MKEFCELSVHYVTVLVVLKLHCVPVDLWINFNVFFIFETQSHFASQADPTLWILLIESSMCWDYKQCATPSH